MKGFASNIIEKGSLYTAFLSPIKKYIMYMYKISVKKDPQIISSQKEIDLGNNYNLTIAKLREYGITEYNSFNIYEDKDAQTCILCIYNKRLETDYEVEKRVIQEMLYNEKYDEFHSPKNK